MDVLPADFVCLPISGPIGKLVEIGQWLNGNGFAPYEHAEIYVGQPDQGGPFGYTVSTYPNGHGRQPLPCAAADLPGSLWSTNKIKLTNVQRMDICEWCIAHQNVQYAALDYFALAAHRLHIPALGLRHYIATSSTMICSQYVDYAYNQCGVHLFTDGRWCGYVTPMDLAKLIGG